MIDLQRQTEHGIAARIEEIAGHELPDDVADVVAEYDEHGGQRDRFLWKRINALLPHVTFSSVPQEYEEAAIAWAEDLYLRYRERADQFDPGTLPPVTDADLLKPVDD